MPFTSRAFAFEFRISDICASNFCSYGLERLRDKNRAIFGRAELNHFSPPGSGINTTHAPAYFILGKVAPSLSSLLIP